MPRLPCSADLPVDLIAATFMPGWIVPPQQVASCSPSKIRGNPIRINQLNPGISCSACVEFEAPTFDLIFLSWEATNNNRERNPTPHTQPQNNPRAPKLHPQKLQPPKTLAEAGIRREYNMSPKTGPVLPRASCQTSRNPKLQKPRTCDPQTLRPQHQPEYPKTLSPNPHTRDLQAPQTPNTPKRPQRYRPLPLKFNPLSP